MAIEQLSWDLRRPKVLEAPADQLSFNTVYGRQYINVQVPHYTGMVAGHTIKACFASGRHTFRTETLTVAKPSPQNLIIPILEVVDAIDSVTSVSYSVRPGAGAPVIYSEILDLLVTEQPFDLPKPRLSNDRRNVTVKFLGMVPGYTVRVRWHGVVVRDTENQPIQNDSSMSFSIPEQWRSENKDREVSINFSLHRSGSDDNLMFSRLLRVTF